MKSLCVSIRVPSDRTEHGNTMSPIFSLPVYSALGISPGLHRANAPFFAISVRCSGLRLSALASPPLALPEISSAMLAPFLQIMLAFYHASMYCQDAFRGKVDESAGWAAHITVELYSSWIRAES